VTNKDKSKETAIIQFMKNEKFKEIMIGK